MVNNTNALRSVLPSLGVLVLVMCAFCISQWLALPWPGMASLGLVATALTISAVFRPAAASWPRVALACSWLGCAGVPISIWLEKDRSHVADFSYALLAWIVGLAILLTGFLERENRKKWHFLAMTCGFLGAGLWLYATYLQNNRIGFHLAVGLSVILLIVFKVAFRLPGFAIISVNTLLLLLVLFPVADFFLRPNYDFKPQADDGRRLYSYEVARQDPSAFAAWWANYVSQFHRMMAELGSSGSNVHTGMLAPHSEAAFFQSRIRINNRGFRGPDIPDDTVETYRIVALGESTTFGATLRATDKPWPEVLEELIRENLRPACRVQVINAGIPALTIADNVKRMPVEILPLKPNMIISYHGINGFGLFDKAMPRIYGHGQPAYKARPLKLLADAEYRVKMAAFRQSLVPKVAPFQSGTNALADTDYARAYEQLIRIADTNHIRLALANFSMAVNDQSPPDVVAFYRAGFPSVHWQIIANKLHSTLVRDLGKLHPEVHVLDSHPELDGEHEKYIDLIHLTQEGRVQLAQNIFASIKDVLERDLCNGRVGTSTNIVSP